MSSQFIDIGAFEDVPPQGARVVETAGGRVAIFRTAEDMVFAIADRCPHLGGPLSQGIVHGDRVTCPLHNLIIDLSSGSAIEPDEGCVARYDIRVEEGRVLLEVSALARAGAA